MAPSSAIVMRGTAVVSIRVTLASCGNPWRNPWGTPATKIDLIVDMFLVSVLDFLPDVPPKSSLSGRKTTALSLISIVLSFSGAEILQTWHPSNNGSTKVVEEKTTPLPDEVHPFPPSAPGRLWHRPRPPVGYVQSRPPGFCLAKMQNFEEILRRCNFSFDHFDSTNLPQTWKTNCRRCQWNDPLTCSEKIESPGLRAQYPWHHQEKLIPKRPWLRAKSGDKKPKILIVRNKNSCM